ncbi:MAG: response regulator transcription factor, partial [Alcaligenaceae bacterium]
MNSPFALRPVWGQARRVKRFTEPFVTDIFDTATFGLPGAGWHWHPACYGLCTMAATSQGKRRVALLDDHPIISVGIAAMLSREQDFEVVGTYDNSRALIEGLATRPADVLVIDYALGREDLDGATLIRTLTDRFADARLIVYSAHYEPAAVASALRS